MSSFFFQKKDLQEVERECPFILGGRGVKISHRHISRRLSQDLGRISTKEAQKKVPALDSVGSRPTQISKLQEPGARLPEDLGPQWEGLLSNLGPSALVYLGFALFGRQTNIWDPL